ncbi:MAG TPA: hypothetical protein VFU15_17575, partial [Bacteroidia bacterium]|nr:hypothetical protein [Bacteroidia bacterium]
VQAKEFMEAVKRLGNRSQVAVIIIPRNITTASAETRTYMARAERARYISRCAIVINSIAQRIIGNFFMRVNKPAMKTKLFNTPGQAWNWLCEAEEKE